MSRLFHSFENLSLNTERLIIEPFKDDDLKCVYDMHAASEVNKYIPYNTWQSWSDAEDWLSMIHQRRVDKEAQLFSLKNKATDDLIGTSLVFGADKTDQDLNFGYVIALQNWGLGFASEAMKALTTTLLLSPNIPLLNATIQEGNVASMKVLNKLGFDEIGKDVEEDGTLIRRFKKFSS